jgi:hypothetical protein
LMDFHTIMYHVLVGEPQPLWMKNGQQNRILSFSSITLSFINYTKD